MNISKNILTALVFGVTFAGTTSCEKANVKEELGVHEHSGDCDDDKPRCGFGDTNDPEPCPTCGMG